MMKSKKIYLIEKGWIDPLENREATGYEIHSYTESEEEAIKFCEKHGYWTGGDCWEISFTPNNKMPKYRYREVEPLKNIK